MFFSVISSIFKSRASLQLENMMLRKQIDILMRRQKRPLVHNRDRLLFVLLSMLYTGWKKAFLIFQ
ncbi:MAG: integrase, partial [Candidatus Marinimicrobia bacterium]|nr:integrase [Candidatus Neomarinimicrobiota bacterium]